MDYYLYKNDQNIGPLPESEIVGGLRNGRFSAKDLGCRVGDSDWKDLSFFFPSEVNSPVSAPVKSADFHTPILQAQAPYQTDRQNRQSQQLAIINQPSYMQPAANPSPAVIPYRNGNYFLGPRFLALLIDGLISIPLAIFAAIPFAGIIGAPLFCLYLVSRDAIFGGQSIGKRVMGLRVIKSDGQPFTWGDSVKRNIIYTASLLLIIPAAGHFLHGVVAAPLGIIEIILVLSGGQRIGDRMGNTYVVRA